MQVSTVSLTDKINGYDFSPIVAHAIKEKPELVTSASTALNQYKAFIQLIVECSGKLAVPSLMVDTIWHSHILHTREYAEFCHTILGVDFIHHAPHSANTSDLEKKQERQNLINASVKVFGENVFTLGESECNVDVNSSSSCDGASDNN